MHENKYNKDIVWKDKKYRHAYQNQQPPSAENSYNIYAGEKRCVDGHGGIIFYRILHMLLCNMILTSLQILKTNWFDFLCGYFEDVC